MKFPKQLASLAAITLLCSTIGATSTITFSSAALALVGHGTQERAGSKEKPTVDTGALDVIDATGRSLGKCPLKHTAVNAHISGYVSRVKVEQTFTNPYAETVEAVYTFPLSDTGAVDQMTMLVGGRTISGVIKTKEEARKTYEIARQQGRTASLLDQERANIFTQSVANIPPKGTVKIEIEYVEYLPYENGSYTFAFPMVVAPRYMPGTTTGKEGTGWSPDTTQVPDASKISTPIVPENTRAGHDISLHVKLDAGIPIQTIESKLHKVEIKKAPNAADVTLSSSDSIPNRDFVLTWKVATERLQSGYLTHREGDTGYFSVMLMPPAKVVPSQISPRELNFIVDRSGSQQGLPLQKARETMLYILDRLNPNDTFQIISFSSETEKCFPKPMPVTQQNVSDAKKYVADLEANGGTEMKGAVEEATKAPAPEHRLRIFIPMTDGLIGNDKEIIGMVKRTRDVSRWFTFGTGNSVNRFLIDGMAKAGGGEPEYVLLNSSGEDVAKKFFDRISSPVLTDIKVEFKGIEVKEVQPRTFNDVWAQRPLYITGKYKKAGTGSVTVKGFSGGKPYSATMDLNFPAKDDENSVLPQVWARAKVEELTQIMNEEAPHAGFSRSDLSPLALETRDEIEKLGLQYHLLTDYTSFVAVDESGPKLDPSKKKLTVAGETPDGMSLNKVFGKGLTREAVRGSGRFGGDLLYGRPLAFNKLVVGNNGSRGQGVGAGAGAALGSLPGKLAQLSSVDKYTFFPGNVRESADIGRIENPKDVNFFQVEPTVIDERHYTSGRSERHQKTSPTLPAGSPVPDTDEAPTSKKLDGRINPKFDTALQKMWSSAKDDDPTKVTLILHVAQYTKELLAKLKSLQALKVIAIHIKRNEIVVRVPLSLAPKLAELKDVQQITLSTKQVRQPNL